MWFVLAFSALTIVAIGGIYTKRRVCAALRALGRSEVFAKRVGRGMSWLLFGYPVLFISYILVALAIGVDEIRPPNSAWITWLLGIPFWISILVMLQALPYLLIIEILRRTPLVPRDSAHVQRRVAIATLLPLAIFAIYTPARILIERDQLNVKNHAVGRGDASLRIVVLGDLQQDRVTDQGRANDVIDIINAQRADLVLSPGDWINSGPEFIEAATASAGRLRSRLGTFSAEGDHENFAYRDQERSMREVRQGLAANGVELLHNEVRWFEHDGKRLVVIFAAYNYIFRTPLEEIERLITSTKDADYRILVSHQFDADLADLAKDEVDLVLAGHTHGGQVNPVVGFWHVPLARIETEHVEGRYSLGDRTTVIVTAGIGFSLAPFRYASPASIDVVDLRF